MNEQGIQPTISCYNILLQSCTKERNPTRAESVLFKMQSMAETGELDQGPDVKSYGNVLSCYAQVGDETSAYRAIKLLYRMEEDDTNVMPDRVCYNIVLNALAELGDSQGAQAVVEDMLQGYQQGTHQIAPNTALFNCILIACSKSSKDDLKEEAERARATLHQMHELSSTLPTKPNSRSYAACFASFAKSSHPDAGLWAKEALREKEELFDNGDARLKPTLKDKADVVASLANSYDLKEAETMLMDFLESDKDDSSSTFDVNRLTILVLRSFLRGCSESQDPSAAIIAESTVKYVEKLRRETNEKRYKLDMTCYNHVLLCWALSPLPEAGERAEKMLNNIESRFQSGQLGKRAGREQYHFVLRAFAKQGRADKAEELVLNMFGQYMAGNESAKPNTAIFNEVLAAWSLSGSFRAAEKVQATIENMENYHSSKQFDSKPDVISYNFLLRCLVKDTSARGIEKAEATFRDLYGKAVILNQQSYQILIKGCEDAGDNERANRLREEMNARFEPGKKAGIVEEILMTKANGSTTVGKS